VDSGNAVEFAEVRFYFRITVQSHDLSLACVSCYSRPHEGLLQASRGTLWSCTHHEAIKVIDITSISAVVAMVPHEPFPGEKRLFLVQKPGLDTTTIGGSIEDMMDLDDM
jgi:hypothetical protein